MALTATPSHLEGILALWGIARPLVTPSSWGINNKSWFVESSAGHHVLRLYSTGSRKEVTSEHDLLRQLVSVGLPFATPVPIASRDGSTAPVVDTPGGQRVAALFGRIEGDHVDDDDIRAIEAAAAAFAQLDRAIATLETDRPSADARLERVHPLVRDIDALDELGRNAAAFVRRMAGGPTELRATLRPRQLIHEDFAFGNVLVRDGAVAAVLDFEFAAHDARAAELACALRLALSKSTRELIWRPLLRGYLAHLQLTDSEVAALPQLALHHEAVTLVWWLGRLRAGDDVPRLAELAARATELERWLDARGEGVVREAREFLRRT